ncbi:hypothetical protein F3Y22_tig00111662pilonHSYRG00057 [Hibiscus syriacus]|uniref:Uncharacterized protein n=1 Tax=Hibiscus syriacus TaxID=106335 RepID=A0A6A2YFN5_HIBSY|nr:hypothetical protein F3Y22_tig00111662pilonHSYRG00057 [Hibiscus syriacus]
MASQDYRTYYPITLPMRRPYSGDPGRIWIRNRMRELLILLKISAYWFLPVNLPLPKQSASRKGKEKVEKSVSLERAVGLTKGQQLEELPAGHVGKMLVYKGGAVKLKLGETLFDVMNAGYEWCVRPGCCVIGELAQKAVVTPETSIF